MCSTHWTNHQYDIRLHCNNQACVDRGVRRVGVHMEEQVRGHYTEICQGIDFQNSMFEFLGLDDFTYFEC